MHDVKANVSLTNVIGSKDTITDNSKGIHVSEKNEEYQKVSDALAGFSELLDSAREKLNIVINPQLDAKQSVSENPSGFVAGGKSLQESGNTFPFNVASENNQAKDTLDLSIQPEELETGSRPPAITESESMPTTHRESSPASSSLSMETLSIFGYQMPGIQAKEMPGSRVSPQMAADGVRPSHDTNIGSDYFDHKSELNHIFKDDTLSNSNHGRSIFNNLDPEGQSVVQGMLNTGRQGISTPESAYRNLPEMAAMDGYQSAASERFSSGVSNGISHELSMSMDNNKDIFPGNSKNSPNTVFPVGLNQPSDITPESELIKNIASIAASNPEAKLSSLQNTGQSAPPVTRLDTAFGQPGWTNELVLRVNGLAVSSAYGEQTANIQLRPAELGSVEVKLVTEGDSARVHFVVQNHAAREAIESALPRLRDSFEQVGLSLDSSNVSSQSRQERSDQGAHDKAYGYSGSESERLDSGEQLHAEETTQKPNLIREHAGLSGEIDLYI